MPNTDLTVELIEEEVMGMLGASSVAVELSGDDLILVTKRALRVYNRYLPYRGRATLSVSTSVKKYRVDNIPEIPTGFTFKGITNMEFVQRRVDPAGVDPFDPYVTSLAGPNAGDETFADVDQRRQYAKTAQRVISSEPEWHAQWEEAEYYVYVDIVRTDTSAGLHFIAGYPNTDAGRQLLPEADVDWFLGWCIAEAKIILARVRGKFAGITNPDGGVDEVDWSTLKEEAESEKITLEEEIRARKRPYLPVIE